MSEPTTIIERAAFVAEYQANAALRAGRKSDTQGFAAHRARLEDFIDHCDYPNLTTLALCQLLGRGKAMVLGVSRNIINNSERLSVFAEHYDAV